jgi:hypothetical protein
VLLAIIGALGWRRFGQPFEYGYMKSAAYAGFVVWGLFAFGAQRLASDFRFWILDFGLTKDERRRTNDEGRTADEGRRATDNRQPTTDNRQSTTDNRLLTIIALLPLLVAGWAQALVVSEHAVGPAIFTNDVTAFDQAAAQIPTDATVTLSSAESLTGPVGGLFNTMLYGREQWGHAVTAYANLNYWPEGKLPQYALLAAEERPWPLELGGQEIWRSNAAALYRFDESTQWLGGRAALYKSTPPTNKEPLALALWRRGGPNRVAQADAPLTIAVGETLRFGEGTTGGSGPRQLRLTLASLMAQQAQVKYGDTNAEIALVAGVNHLDLQLDAPTTLTITPEAPLALIEATAQPLEQAGSVAAPPGAQQSSAIAWSAAAQQNGPIMQVRLDLANPERHALRVGLTVVEDTFERPNQIARLLAAAPIEGTWQINIDPIRGATEALVNDAPTPLIDVNTATNPPDSVYFGVLTLYDGEAAIVNTPVFTMRIAEGQIAAFDPVLFTVEATQVGKPNSPLPSNQTALLGGSGYTLDGQQATLEAAVMARSMPWPGAPNDTPLTPGAPLNVQLFWHAPQANGQPLMVSAQLLGPDDRKWAQWDGPIGGNWRPIQGWQAGDRVRQDVPLTLDAATPPGEYRLLLVVYDPATGQPQPFAGQGALVLGEVTVSR